MGPLATLGRGIGRAIGLAAIFLGCSAMAQQTVIAPPPPGPPDPVVQAAEQWIGRALFLRGFYGGASLTYDAAGHVKGAPPIVDWTLAGMDVVKVTRLAPGEGSSEGELELEGPRVAIRYNPDAHTFDRHAQKDELLKVIFAAKDAAGVQAMMAAIFSVGIDPALERSTPPYWKHYFLPATAWPPNENPGAITTVTGTTPPAGLVMPVVEKKVEPDYPGEAQRDRVKGTVQIRLAVGPDGLPHQIRVLQPLGYGLDAKTVDAVGKYRFKPGTMNGKPVAVEMTVNQEFVVPTGK